MRHLYFILLICFSLNLSAQKIALRKDLIHYSHSNQVKQSYSGLHGFYKKYISSQDGSNCQFSPSCSHYAKLSIKKHGFILGVFLGSDRILRCNGRTDDYFTDKDNKAIDHP